MGDKDYRIKARNTPSEKAVAAVNDAWTRGVLARVGKQKQEGNIDKDD